MNDRGALLELKHVTKAYDSAVPVLKDVSFSVSTGDTVSIVGASGCGKSTMLNLIGALDLPTSGEVHFDGANISELSETALAEFRNRSIGFIFQSHHLLPQCTALENVLVPALVKGIDSETRERAVSLLDRVGLAERKDYMPGKLSGGECQRVAVVRALINRPKLLLADEPTGSLSKSGSESLTELLLELNRDEGMALIVVTHALSIARMMETVYMLEEGALGEYTGGDV